MKTTHYKRFFGKIRTGLAVVLLSLWSVTFSFDAVVRGETFPAVVYLSTIKDAGLIVPARVGVDNVANTYVSDPRTQRVYIFNAAGEYKRFLRGTASPLGVAVDGDRNIYVGDSANKNVSLFDPSDSLLGKLGSGDGEFELPGDIAVDSDSGKIYVSDSKANIVRVYNADGSLASTISDLIFPTGIYIDAAQGELLVSDSGNYQVKVFALSSGALLRSFGSMGSSPGKFFTMQGLAVDSLGRIYVADSYKGWVQVFDSVGNHLGYIGEGDLRIPMDVVFDRFNRLMVTSSSTSSVVIYGIDGGDLPEDWKDEDFDSDGDGMTDVWENAQGLDPYANDAALDPDGDGLTNLEEFLAGTDPHNADTDGDGLPDNVDPFPTAAADNRPQADAGPDQTTDPGIVTLDGTGSSDPNRFTLTYSWTPDEANPGAVTLSGNNSPTARNPSFLATAAGVYHFSLAVSNVYLDGVPDDVYITINNITPTADAGMDRNINVGDLALLDGTGSSDANGDTLTFAWTQVSGAAANLSGGNTAAPFFTPQESGVYLFRLTVSDGVNTSGPDDVAITANIPNSVPVADAGDDQVVTAGTIVTLDGSGSIDGDGDPLTYAWEQVSGTAAALSDPAAMTPAFTPADSGVYTFSLTVSDGIDVSLTDPVNITVNGANEVPVAHAGEDQEVVVYSTVTLGGGMSYDTDNSPSALAYQWTQVYGTTVSLDDPASMTPSFVPIYQGTMRFSLVVSDGQDAGLPDEVEIVVTGTNTPPAADAGEDQRGITGLQITLDGTGSSDADGDVLTYQWAQMEGASVTLSDIYSPQPVFTPARADIYRFMLAVRDNLYQDSDTVIVTIDAPDNRLPVADAGDRQFAPVNTTVMLDGSRSYDTDGDDLTYKWSQISRYGRRVELKDADTATPTFVPPKKGNFHFSLTVNDEKGDSAPDEVKISVVSPDAVLLDVPDGADNSYTVDTLPGFQRIDLWIPDESIQEDIRISVAEETEPPPAPDEIRMVGATLDLSPDGTIFDSNIKIRIPYTLEQLTEANIADLGALKAYTYNEEIKQWEEVTVSRIDRDGQYVEIETDHFSLYRLGTGTADEDVSPETSSGESGGVCFITISDH